MRGERRRPAASSAPVRGILRATLLLSLLVVGAASAADSRRKLQDDAGDMVGMHADSGGVVWAGAALDTPAQS